MSRDRNEAPSTQGSQKSPLCRTSETRGRVVERANDFVNCGVVRPSLDSQRALTNRRKHKFITKVLRYPICVAEPVKPGGRQHDGVETAFIEFAEPCVDVASNRNELKIRTRGAKLRLSAKTACADYCVLRKLLKRICAGASNEHIARVFAFAYRADLQPCGKLGRQVLETVDGNVDSTSRDRVFEFLGEETFALLPEFRKRYI